MKHTAGWDCFASKARAHTSVTAAAATTTTSATSSARDRNPPLQLLLLILLVVDGAVVILPAPVSVGVLWVFVCVRSLNLGINHKDTTRKAVRTESGVALCVCVCVGALPPAASSS